MPLKLFEVVRWGSDPDPNGPDTIFLVRAEDHEKAAELVRPRLHGLPHEHVRTVVSFVAEIGIDSGSGREPRILRGPLFEHAYNHGYLTWTYDEEHARWEAEPSGEDGPAEAYYPDGRIAARFHFRGGRRDGPSEQWHPNGEPMRRGEYRVDHWVGVLEEWHDNGTPSARHEFWPGRRGVTVTEWHPDGEPIRTFSEDWVEARRGLATGGE